MQVLERKKLMALPEILCSEILVSALTILTILWPFGTGNARHLSQNLLFNF